MLIKIKKIDESIVFPQANDIYKVIKYVDQFLYKNYNEYLKHISIIMVERQADYYKNAARYIGLFEGNKPTSVAEHLFKLDKNILFISIVQLILENEIFYNYFKNRDKNEIIDCLKFKYKMNYTTAIRRSSTVVNWINWVDVIVEENNLSFEVEVDG